jgi:hypothetical protein
MNTSKGILKREEIREKLSSKSRLGRWANLRLVEYELLERGVHVPRTPGSLKSSPRWMKLGFRLFEELGKFGYQPYPGGDASKQYFECQGEAAFWNLLGHAPLKDYTAEAKRVVVLQLCSLPVGCSFEDHPAPFITSTALDNLYSMGNSMLDSYRLANIIKQTNHTHRSCGRRFYIPS